MPNLAQKLSAASLYVMTRNEHLTKTDSAPCTLTINVQSSPGVDKVSCTVHTALTEDMVLRWRNPGRYIITEIWHNHYGSGIALADSDKYHDAVLKAAQDQVDDFIKAWKEDNAPPRR
jgi:hypothetical protein